MTRPIVWAIGTVVTTVISATAAGDRIAAQFGFGMPQARFASPPTAQSGNRIEVSADLRGHFVVHPTVDGRRVRMLVDTGASVVVLSHEDAGIVGIRVSSRDYTRRIETANGVVQAAPVRFSEVKVRYLGARRRRAGDAARQARDEPARHVVPQAPRRLRDRAGAPDPEGLKRPQWVGTRASTSQESRLPTNQIRTLNAIGGMSDVS
jgi:aspartyl protease family protein